MRLFHDVFCPLFHQAQTVSGRSQEEDQHSHFPRLSGAEQPSPRHCDRHRGHQARVVSSSSHATTMRVIRHFRKFSQSSPDILTLDDLGVDTFKLRMWLPSSLRIKWFTAHRTVSELATVYAHSLRMSHNIDRYTTACSIPPYIIHDRNYFCHCRYDFFLVSQSVRQGTVTPTHFNVIFDSSGLRPDHMQRLTYKLCHLYYNWPVSVTSSLGIILGVTVEGSSRFGDVVQLHSALHAVHLKHFISCLNFCCSKF